MIKRDEGEGSDEGIGMEECEPGDGGSVIVVIDSEGEGEQHLNTEQSGMESGSVLKCCGMELTQSDLCTLKQNRCLNDQVRVTHTTALQ